LVLLEKCQTRVDAINENRTSPLPFVTAGIIVLGFLGYQAQQSPLTFVNLAVGLTFIFLIVFSTTFGVPVPGGVVSLLPMTTVSAFLVGGALPAGIAAFFGAFLNEGVRYVFNEQLGIQRRLSKFGTLSVACANAAIQTTSILPGGWIYRLIGGTVPFTRITGLNIVALIALSSIYLLANIVLIAVYMFARGTDVLKMYLKSLPNVVLFEASPLVFLPLLPLIYTQLGLGVFILFGLAIVVTSLISRRTPIKL
jgi:hypothetical protein